MLKFPEQFPAHCVRYANRYDTTLHVEGVHDVERIVVFPEKSVKVYYESGAKTVIPWHNVLSYGREE